MRPRTYRLILDHKKWRLGIAHSELTVLRESYRNIKEGELGAAVDVLRHEGLKKVVEWGLNATSRFELGESFLSKLAGEKVCDPRLETFFGGMTFHGPVGIAPGWDKTGRSILAWQAMGAHHITVGGVTLYPQIGNPMPRLRTFHERVGDHGKSKSLNAYGFYNHGADVVRRNVANQRAKASVDIPVFVQVTANKELYEPLKRVEIPEAIAKTVHKMIPVADGINFGLSSPNTLGMRDAQAYEFLKRIISAGMEAGSKATNRDIPYILKGDADGGEERLDMYCRLAVELGVSLELINTSGLRRLKQKYGAEDMPGGLAGADPDYQQMAINSVSYVHEAVGDKVDIIGAGGINNGLQAWKMKQAGAKLLSINTAVREMGVKVVRTIERELLAQELQVA